jgi:adenine-specific DNA-methyltransferase
LTGILNSKLLHFWLYFKGKREGNHLQIDKAPILSLPIKTVSEKDQRPIIALVERLMNLTERLESIGGKQTDERADIVKKISETNSEIDSHVYAMYRLSEREKKIIEDSLK